MPLFLRWLSNGSKPLSPLRTKHCVSGEVSKVRPSSKAMWKSKAFLPVPEIFKKTTRLNLWAVAGFLDALGGF